MGSPAERAAEGFSTLAEKSLHADLKAWYARPGDGLEVPVDGFVVDVVRNGLLVEIQTGRLSSLNRKVTALAAVHRVRVVYPIAAVKWIVRIDNDGSVLGRRRSPSRGCTLDLFRELVHGIPIMRAPRAELQILLTSEEEIRRRDDTRRGRHRHGWVVEDRRLVGIVGSRIFRTPGDLLALVPGHLPEPFTTQDLAAAIDRPLWLGQRMAYCLRETAVLETVGKRGNAFLYRRSRSERSACRRGGLAAQQTCPAAGGGGQSVQSARLP